MLTWSLFLVTLKKSSMRVCLLCPAALSFSLSSRLLSLVWRNLSIRRRTLSSLKTHQHEYSHNCLWKRQRSTWNESWAGAKIKPWVRTWHVWPDRGTQPRLLRLAQSTWVRGPRFVVPPRRSSVLLCTSRNVAQDGSQGQQIIVSY